MCKPQQFSCPLVTLWYHIASFGIHRRRVGKMVKFTLRVDDDTLVSRFDELAREHGMTRTALIVQLMQDALDAGYVPMRPGEGLRAITGSGAEVSLERREKYVSSGRAGLLTDEQEAAFDRA